MKKLTFLLSLFALLSLLTACGGDDAPDSKQSAEAKAMTEELGGPFTADEFAQFLKTLPSIPGLTAQGHGAVAGDALNAQITAAAATLGWSEERFTYIYSHAISMLSMEQVDATVKQMEDQMAGMPAEQQELMKQMMGGELDKQRDTIKAEVDKQVPASEQKIIMDNMDELKAALGFQQ